MSNKRQPLLTDAAKELILQNEGVKAGVLAKMIGVKNDTVNSYRLFMKRKKEDFFSRCPITLIHVKNF